MPEFAWLIGALAEIQSWYLWKVVQDAFQWNAVSNALLKFRFS
jgi:hypothetical protein